MGGICGKSSSAVKDGENSPKQRVPAKESNDLRVARAVSSKRDDNLGLHNRLENGELRIGLIDKKTNGSRRVRDDYCERDEEISEAVHNFPEIWRVTKSMEGEHVAADWPPWLVNVAGEAIRGWIPRKADSFEKLDKIGQGTYSIVYKGRDLVNNKIVALKKVCFDRMDPESVKFMAREILILRRLDHPNVIKLEALVTSRTSSSLYLVFEYMEHDLTGLASLPGFKFTEPQIKCYMQQLLSGLDHCHCNGVLHRDIKGSNLLINNQGILKIADFGLASYFSNQKGVQLTSRVVTLWYRPPELLLGATRYGVAVDLWSAGCILGELYTGKPIMAGRTEVEQLHKIFKLCGSPSEDFWRKYKLYRSTAFKPIYPYRRRISETYKDLPDVAVRFMEVLLSIDPEDRGTAAGALKNEFFGTQPLACDPSTIPKYPPSKELDAKLREEGAKRQEPANAGEHDQNAEILRSMQRRQNHANRKSQVEFFNPHTDEATTNLPPTRDIRQMSQDHAPNTRERIYNSGPLVDSSTIIRNRDDLSTLSDLASSRCLSYMESRDKLLPSQVETTNAASQVESYGVPMRKLYQKHQVQMFSCSQIIDY